MAPVPLRRATFGRRAVLAALLARPASAVAHGISVVMPAASALQAQRAGHIPQVPARLVRNGWGVCGRPGQDAPAETYARLLGQIGTRDLRVPLVQYGRSAAPALQALRVAMRAGRLAEPVPRVTALVTAYMNDLATGWDVQQRALLEFAASGMVRAIEGPNEIDNGLAGLGAHGPADRVLHAEPGAVTGNFLAWSQALGRFRQDNARLRGLTLVAPSLAVGPPAAQQRLPDVSAFVDAGNLHFYAGHGRQPNYSMRFDPFVGTFQNMLHWASQSQVGGGRVWLTECGASTSGDYARDGVSQAKYLANQLLGLFAAGGQRLFFYNLLDGSSRPGDTEGNFGLFRHDLTPKPAALMLRRLADLLSIGAGHDDPANASDTAPFTPAYDARRLVIPRLSEAGSDDPNCLVLPKSDRRTLLAVWNEPVIDDGRGRELDVAAHTLVADLGSAQSFVVHDVLADGGSPRRRGRFVELSLRGCPMIVELLGE